jgi:dCTP deaminase
MALSDNEIVRAIKTQELRVTPRAARINPGGIDLRINREVTLQPGKHTLVASRERIELSEKILGILHIRSSLAREGLIASLALVDPGFRGQLTVNMYNAGDRPVRLRSGERFIQLSLVRLGVPAAKIYDGKYQESRGVVHSRRRKNLLRHRKS